MRDIIVIFIFAKTKKQNKKFIGGIQSEKLHFLFTFLLLIGLFWAYSVKNCPCVQAITMGWRGGGRHPPNCQRQNKIPPIDQKKKTHLRAYRGKNMQIFLCLFGQKRSKSIFSKSATPKINRACLCVLYYRLRFVCGGYWVKDDRDNCDYGGLSQKIVLENSDKQLWLWLN